MDLKKTERPYRFAYDRLQSGEISVGAMRNAYLCGTSQDSSLQTAASSVAICSA